MGIQTKITTDSWGTDGKGWLLHRKGMDTCRTITLNLALFTTGLGFSTFIPSGTVVGRVTASGLYGPYDPDGNDGREVARGHLLNAVELADSEGNAFDRSVVAMLWEGIVRRDKLPAFSGNEGELDSAAEADLPNIRYER